MRVCMEHYKIEDKINKIIIMRASQQKVSVGELVLHIRVTNNIHKYQHICLITHTGRWAGRHTIQNIENFHFLHVQAWRRHLNSVYGSHPKAAPNAQREPVRANQQGLSFASA